MRNIIFRGKRIDNGEWEYGDLLQYDDGAVCIGVHSKNYTDDGFNAGQYRHIVPVDENTVGQYTGLKDKKGAMIFEGDILLLSDGKSHSEDVVVEHGLYGWTFYNPQTATFYSDGSHTYVAVENCRFMFGTGVVIGNIHDNPDLLK